MQTNQNSKFQLIKQLYSNKFIQNHKNKYSYSANLNPLQRTIKMQKIIKKQPLNIHSINNNNHSSYPFIISANRNQIIHIQNSKQINQPINQQIPTFYYVSLPKNRNSFFKSPKKTLNIKNNHQRSLQIQCNNSLDNQSTPIKSERIYHIMEIFKHKPQKKQIYTPRTRRGITMSKLSRVTFLLNSQQKRIHKTHKTIQDCLNSNRMQSKQLKKQNSQNGLTLQIRRKIQSQKQQRIKTYHLTQSNKDSERRKSKVLIQKKGNKNSKINDDSNDLNPWIVDNEF